MQTEGRPEKWGVRAEGCRALPSGAELTVGMAVHTCEDIKQCGTVPFE